MSNKKMTKPKISNQESGITVAKIGIVASVITLVGVVLTAAFNYLGTRSQIEIPIQATQTAEMKASPSQSLETLTHTPSHTPTMVDTPTLSLATPTMPSSLSIAKVILARSENKNRFEVTVYNSLDREILLTSAKIFQSIRRNYSGNPCTPAPLYELQKQITILPSEGDNLKFAGQIISNSPDLNGYSFPFNGQLLTFCDGGWIDLQFDMSLISSPKSYTKFYIEIPTDFVFTDTYGLSAPNLGNDNNIYFAPLVDEGKISEYEVNIEIQTDFNDSIISYDLNLMR
jgi:hypothetical protein